MILYDHPSSGNCLKPRILLRQLELPFERVTVDLFTGETRTPEHFGRNPDGRVPAGQPKRSQRQRHQADEPCNASAHDGQARLRA